MPVILERSDWPIWLGEEDGNLERLMRPAPDGMLRLWPVSRDVNWPMHNRPDLVEPIMLSGAQREEDEAGPNSP